MEPSLPESCCDSAGAVEDGAHAGGTVTAGESLTPKPGGEQGEPRSFPPLDVEEDN